MKKGTYRGIKVAIKTLKRGSKFPVKNFLAEASVMTDLKHPNLVRLMGIHIDETGSNPVICLITEFMMKVGIFNCINYPWFFMVIHTQGSLIDYLRTRGRAVITRQNQYSFAWYVYTVIPFMDLITNSLSDVAKGMAYLEGRDLVHR